MPLFPTVHDETVFASVAVSDNDGNRNHNTDDGSESETGNGRRKRAVPFCSIITPKEKKTIRMWWMFRLVREKIERRVETGGKAEPLRVAIQEPGR